MTVITGMTTDGMRTDEMTDITEDTDITGGIVRMREGGFVSVNADTDGILGIATMKGAGCVSVSAGIDADKQKRSNNLH